MHWYVVDDHAGFRAAARQMLEAAGEIVVGESDGSDGTLPALVASGADAALIDIDLGEVDGFDLVAALSIDVPAVRCVLISSRPQSTYGRRLLDCSAAGFVSKAELSPERLHAVLG